MIKMEIKKIVAVAFVILGVTILAFSSINLILAKLSLPPYSIQTEGKYVAYSLQVWAFLLTLPLFVSMFLAGYLVFPSMFRRFDIAIRVLSVILAIGGLGITALVMFAATINYLPLVTIPIFIMTSIAGSSPFWIMAVLAILVFKKSKPT